MVKREFVGKAMHGMSWIIGLRVSAEVCDWLESDAAVHDRVLPDLIPFCKSVSETV